MTDKPATLDELVAALRGCSLEEDVQRLADAVAAWKNSPETVDRLRYIVEKYIGNVWLAEEVHTRVYALWSAFAKGAIDQLSGMTMNERLFVFSLLASFDASSAEQKAQLYAKLHARP